MERVPRDELLLAPAYYWAGRGSALVHRLKGFGRPVDGQAYLDAYRPERLRWLRDAGGVNAVFLAYNWGLPPEIEADDWRAFERAARWCHELGMLAIAYIQPSNAVSMGSFAGRGWYALSARGRRIPYYNGRYFTCLNDPAWRDWVVERCLDAGARGADGLFFDNCAFGGMPIPLSRDYSGFAGCACGRCREPFAAWQEAQGLAVLDLPQLFRPGRDEAARRYATWRAEVLTRFFEEVTRVTRDAFPNIRCLTNTVGGVNVNTFNVFGVDLPRLAGLMDWLFVENLQSPRADGRELVQNAGTYKVLRALKPGAPALSICYERGIGVDGKPPPWTFARIAAEGLAAGGSPVLRAGEYVEDGCWALLAPGKDDRRLEAWGEMLRQAARWRGAPREEAARVGVFVGDSLAWRGDLYPGGDDDFLLVVQALIGAGIPLRVIGERTPPCDLGVLLLPGKAPPPPWYAGRVLRFAELGLPARRDGALFRWLAGPLEPIARFAGPKVVDAYYQRVHVRQFVDRLNLLYRFVFGDRYRRVPMDDGVRAMLAATNPVHVRLRGDGFVDLWSSGDRLELHAANYGPGPLVVELVRTPRGRVMAVSGCRPAGESAFQVETYGVVAIEAAGARVNGPLAAGLARG
ncbi:hypothetical protein [Tepidiforma sp.]|uniref:hypothetical protein n=1 Tax=Tepidiforma sp. TaxID=2682230 RepID=UPI002ADE31DC|nr:hypothetical protein [Tepidiforma sp.]